MTDIFPVQPAPRGARLAWLIAVAVAAAALMAAVTNWRGPAATEKPKGKGAEAVPVVSAVVSRSDLPVRLAANGTVSAIQTVEVRPQLSAAIKAVHIKEGQFVRKGERLFTLDARTEEANLGKAEAQLLKDRADLANAERNLERQRVLFQQRFVSQAALDAAQNQVDGLRGQLAVNQAALEASRVSRGYGEITAPIAGRTGAITVYPGSLVQPAGTALVTITQIDPINVSFTLPERELGVIQQALAKDAVWVSATPDAPGQPPVKGRMVFVDNAVDAASGTIRLKAEFANAGNRLWPGMFVSVSLAPRILADALTVPVQAVQTGPEKKFLYVIGDDRKVILLPVKVSLIQDGVAVIDGAAPGMPVVPGMRVVVEGAQNLRPGSAVAEADANGGSRRNTAAQPNGAGRQ